MTSTVLDGRFVLRICVLSFRTHAARMQECVDGLVTSARELLEA